MEKNELMAKLFPVDTLETIRSLKLLFDPEARLNPGRCCRRVADVWRSGRPRSSPAPRFIDDWRRALSFNQLVFEVGIERGKNATRPIGRGKERGGIRNDNHKPSVPTLGDPAPTHRRHNEAERCACRQTA